jgi:hypothetical protein
VSTCPLGLAHESILLRLTASAYSVEKLGLPLRALFRLPRIESDNCGQIFSETILEDSHKPIAVGR